MVGAAPGLGPVAVDEEELVDAVRGGGQEVTAEAEQVAIARVETRDRPAAHPRHFVGDGDARHGRTADVVVGDQERRRALGSTPRSDGARA